jgi:hypothetical protein
VGDSRRRAAAEMKTKGDVKTPRAIGVVVEAVRETRACLCTDSWGARRDSTGLGCRAGRWRKCVAADPMAR